MNRTPVAFVLSCALVAALPLTSSFAATFEVPAGGDIQLAISAASSGDVIELEAGEYFPVGTLDTLGKAITIRGVVDSAGEPASIIDGKGFIRVLQCVEGEGADTLFENLRIQNGFADTAAGMLMTESSPTLVNCTFTGNSADYGGAMRNHESSPTLTGTIVCGNTTDQIFGDWIDIGDNCLSANCDDCQKVPCIGDLNDDGVVNGADLGTLLAVWGECP